MSLPTDMAGDLLSFTFGGPKPYNLNQPLFIDAGDPSRSFTATQFRQLVQTLIAGLKAHNVKPGDCVLLHLGNSVSFIPTLFVINMGLQRHSEMKQKEERKKKCHILFTKSKQKCV